MVKSLFDPKENDEIVNRINKVTANKKPLWGKMNAGQMLQHCQIPLKVAFGEMKLKRGLIGFLFGGIAKKQLLKEEPFKPNLPTAPEFIVKNDPAFDEAKTKLIELVKKFSSGGPSKLTQDPHPFFGKLNTEEWDKLQWKHLDHHLRQFGV